jgi:hypothetical protein
VIEGVVEDVAPQTPANVIQGPKLEDCLDCSGQWTQVRKRKKNKPKKSDERDLLKC